MGSSFSPAGIGGFLGVEGSYFRSYHNTWAGLYLDAVYDFAQEAATVSFGPELGSLLFGVDGGLALRIGAKDRPEVGVQVRAMLNLGFVSLYYRYGAWPLSDGFEGVQQLGLTLKAPIVHNYKSRSFAP